MIIKLRIFIQNNFLLGLLFFSGTAVNAQITPDNTLGAEASRVVPGVLINGEAADRIDGGASRGINLFHSFGEFNIGENQRVYFANPAGIENILTRVTGGNGSNIFGTLGVDGAANLFLINPNGILFGENARLDVRGSFVGTTANGLEFGKQGFFSATNPEAVPLLTVNPSALFFNQMNANAGITNQSQAPGGINPNGDETTGLRVPDGKSFLLVGGNINLDGGRIRAYDGRIELAGLAAPGNIGLNIVEDIAGDITGNTFSLSVPDNLERGDIAFSNESYMSVIGDKGGDIVIQARNIDLNNSAFFAGIAAGKGNENGQGGDVILNATGNVTLSNSFIDNSVYGVGNGGNVLVQAGNAVNLEFADIYSNIEAGGRGNGGDINIEAGSLTLTDNAQILTILRPSENNLPGGRGNAGDVNINVRGAVTLANPRPGFANGILTVIGTGAVGNGGHVTIKADSLALQDGSEIRASSFGRGNGGNITINAVNGVTVDGRSEGGIPSRILNGVDGSDAEGNGGDININTSDLRLTNNGFISSGVLGKGDGGNINVVANNLNLTNDGSISTDVLGKGNGGDINLDVANATILDNIADISSNVFDGGLGNGGNINLKTGSLSLTAGSRFSNNVSGQGNAGNIIVKADDYIQVGGSVDIFLGGIFSSLLTNAIGKGGDIEITTGSLFITNGGSLQAFSDGQGDSGNIIINAEDRVWVESNPDNRRGSQITNFIGINALGNGGKIDITAREIAFTKGSQINTASIGQGNAGTIRLNGRDRITFDGVDSSSGLESGAIAFATGEGRGGDIFINTGTLSVTNGGNLASFASNGAGNIDINAEDAVVIDGTSPEGRSSWITSNLVEGGNSGKGGDVQISTGSLRVTNGGQINSATGGNGNGGNIRINARDSVTFAGMGGNRFSGAYSLVESSGVGNAGRIEITTGSLFLQDSGRLSAASNGWGNAGDISVDASQILISGVAENQYPSGISSAVERTGVGRGGSIRINADDLRMSDRAFLSVNTSGEGDAGSIFTNVTGNFLLENASTINAGTFGRGKAGDIRINVGGKFFLEGITTDGSTFDTGIFSTVGTGSQTTDRAGNINITSGDLSLRRAALSSSNLVEGGGGNLNIQTGSVRLDRKSAIASTTISGNGGNIDLIADKYVFLQGESGISTTAGLRESGGDGGNITIQTPAIVAIPNQNNDITANAFTGRGGRVDIETQGLFGIEPRAIASDTSSDITASSQLGVQGEISVSEPDIDPTQGIIELPGQLEDKSDQIGGVCPRNYAEAEKLGKFIVTGRGSLAPSILEPLTGDRYQPQLATLNGENITATARTAKREQFKEKTEIIEAQGWVKTPDGQVKLVAQVPQPNLSHNSAKSQCVVEQK